MIVRIRALFIALTLLSCLANAIEISVPKDVPHDEPGVPGGSGGSEGSGEPGVPDAPGGGSSGGLGVPAGDPVGGVAEDEPKFELSDLLDLTSLLSLTGRQTPPLALD
jgi:hypothetical protein